MFINLPQTLKKPKKLNKLNFNQHLSIILSLSLIFPNVILADIIADRNAPISNQPTILKTPNSAILVDIVKPSSSGVSMNEYSKFNTSKDGTVLNNSRSGSDSIIGGYIHANPRLSKGTAKLIVNKVNSNKASSLEGNIEIAGDRADLIIANPSGINIDGAHFINSKSTTLTTGEIRYDGNKINSIDVNKGEISINGKGLKDESDYISLISNTAKINANIHANELNIITGNNKVDKDSNILSTNNNDDDTSNANTTNNNPKVSIDSSHLGGMYANKIKLIATKDGVGVNNRGSIVASKSIKISSNGDIINSGDIVSSKEIEIEGKSIDNSGTDKKQASIKSKTLDINSNSLNNKNSIIETNSKLTLKAKELTNKDSIIGKENNQDSKNDQDTNNNTDKNTNNNNQEATNPSSIVVKNTILNDNSKILSNELNLDISGDIKNENSNLDITSINNRLNSIENTNSNFIVDKDVDIELNSLTQDNSNFHSNSNLNIKANDSISNTNDSELSSSKSIDLVASGGIKNINSKIVANEDIDIKAKSLTNTNSKLSSNKNINLSAKENIDNTNSNLESQTIKTTSSDMSLTNSKFIADNKINIKTLNDLTLNSSDLVSNEDIKIDANNNLISKLSLVLASNNIDIKTKTLYTDKKIVANNDISLNSNVIENLGDIKANGIAISSISLYNSSNIVSYDSLDIDTNLLDNKSSLIYAFNGANIKADNIINKNTLTSTSNKGIQAGVLDITSTDLDNKNGNVISNSTLNLDIKNSLNNNSGYIGSVSDAYLKSSLLDNKDGSIISGKNLSINTDKYTNHGSLQAGENLRLSTKDTINYNGGFYAKNNIFIKTTDDFINNTKLISNKDLTIEAKNILNNSFLHSLNDMGLISSLSLTNLGEIAAKNSLAITSNSLTNKGANIYSGGVLVINSEDTLNTDKATIYSKGDMVLNTNTLTNKDSSNIISDKKLDIFYDKLNNLDKDTILNYTKDRNNKALKIDNLSSLIYSGSDMSINAKELNNKSLDELRINPPTTTSGSIDLRNSNQRVIPFGVDVDKLRKDIIETYKINNNYKEPSSSYVEEELKKEIISRNERLYIATLHKNVTSNGRPIYDDIILDFTNNKAIITTSYIRDREQRRSIDYTISKETINEDDLAKFRPSNILSNANIEFLTNSILNDKSIVFANGDISLDNTNLTNQGLNLNHDIKSTSTHVWQEKKKKRWWKRSKWVDVGGIVGTRNVSYHEVGYPAIFAAGGKITGSLTELNNGKINIGTISNNIPNFMRSNQDILYKNITGYNPISTTPQNIDKNSIYSKSSNNIYANDSFLNIDETSILDKSAIYHQDIINSSAISLNSIYSNTLNNLFTINSPNPLFIDNHINPTDEKHYYLNTSYIFDENIPNSDYIHNKLSYIYNFRNSLLKNLLFKDNKPLNPSSLIYASSGISLDIEGNLNNYSDIVSDKFIKIDANNITNYQGDIKSKDELILSANKDILNLSSSIKGGLVYLNANNIINQTLSKTSSLSHSYGDESFTTIGETSTINSSKGDVILNAKDSIYLAGSDISSNSNIALLAKKDIVSDVVKDKGPYHFNFNGGYSKREYEFNKGSSLLANDSINLNSSNGDINIVSTSYTNYYESQTSKSKFGGLSKSTSFINDTTHSQSSSNLLSANNINLKANDINILASKIKSDSIEISADMLNLISSKEINSHTEFKTKSNLLTATIHDKGKITEVEIPSIIEVGNKLIVNDKDITDKLDIKTYKEISNSLNSDEFKDSILNSVLQKDSSYSNTNNNINKFSSYDNINNSSHTDTKTDSNNYINNTNNSISNHSTNTFTLSSNSNTPLNIDEINQIKATLNSKEWDEKTTTLSGIGSLVVTAVVTYLTAGAGSGMAAGLGMSSASTTSYSM